MWQQQHHQQDLQWDRGMRYPQAPRYEYEQPAYFRERERQPDMRWRMNTWEERPGPVTIQRKVLTGAQEDTLVYFLRLKKLLGERARELVVL